MEYEEYAIETPMNLEILSKALKIAKIKPIVLSVRRSLFSVVETALRKTLSLYTVIEEDEEYVRLYVTYPERFFRLHREFQMKSFLLADPEVMAALIRYGEPAGSGTVKSPMQMVTLIKEWCSAGYRFILLTPLYYPGRSYIVCKSGTLQGVVFQESEIHIGVRALRLIFYMGPYRYILYNIRVEEL